MAAILIIDDDKMICHAIRDVAVLMGYDASYALTLKEGLSAASSGDFDVVFLDVRLPDGNGLKGLNKFRQVSCSPEVVIITGEGDADGAEFAIKSGAWDYIEKPLTAQSVALPLTRALQYRQQKRVKTGSGALKRAGIIGSSPKMAQCMDLLAQAAGGDGNTLFTGETGTGKELFARLIHENSLRSNDNFVVVDCAALPAMLVETILFGHTKGAFTGADRDREGLVRQAHGGILFLDEVGELPLSVQGAFLRVLQEHRFRPVGSKQEVESDFRLVAATNRDLGEMVKAGAFRKDLFFRLRSTVIHLPPLRERGADIIAIALYYLNQHCERYGAGTKGLSTDFVEALQIYDWPGNVRELIHALESSVSRCGNDPTLFRLHLPEEIQVALARGSVGNGASKNEIALVAPDKKSDMKNYLPSLHVWMEQVERQYLQDLVVLTGGDVKEACLISGLPRSSLYFRLKKHHLTLQPS